MGHAILVGLDRLSEFKTVLETNQEFLLAQGAKRLSVCPPQKNFQANSIVIQ